MVLLMLFQSVNGKKEAFLINGCQIVALYLCIELEHSHACPSFIIIINMIAIYNVDAVFNCFLFVRRSFLSLNPY